MRLLFSILFFILFQTFALPQVGFEYNSTKNKITIPFQLINNLIFIPINVNGMSFNFLLDTGVQETVLFGLEPSESDSFRNVEKVQFKGFGNLELIEGIKSSSNKLFISDFVDNNHELYIILNQDFNLSSQIGISVNGIIGSKFFTNYIIETNYSKKKIFIYKKKSIIQKKLENKFFESEISIEKSKPYLKTKVILNNQEIETKLLIDSGSGDSIWLFENQKNRIRVPSQNFSDFLGRGFTGELFGKRARIDKLIINKFHFDNPLTSFPDSLAIINSNLVLDREGSIGGEILKRFNVVYDYPEQKIYFQKNQNFNLLFNFNMSGIEIEHDGLQWFSEFRNDNSSGNTKIAFTEAIVKPANLQYFFSLKPVFRISNIRQNSPADLSGLLKSDVVLEINSNKVHDYSLQEINELLKSEDGKIIKMKVIRNNIEYEYKFQLKSML